jgi:Mg2+ and Co2+ transporter CorA
MDIFHFEINDSASFSHKNQLAEVQQTRHAKNRTCWINVTHPSLQEQKHIN